MKLLSVLFVLLPAFVFANKQEESRILVHTLNYLGHDYLHAVKDGKVIDPEEYAEMKEFCESAEKYFKEFSTEWSDEDSAAAGELVEKVVLLVEQKADFEVVAKAAIEAKTKIIAVTGLKTFPVKYPDIANGKKVFTTACIKCHGTDGFGDGPEAKELNPKPRNFHDDERMKTISASHIFNTVRLGVQGTGMKSHPELSDNEVWDVAFYVLTLRYPESENKGGNEMVQKISLEKIALLTDEDLRGEFGLNNNQLFSLRWNQPKQASDKFLLIAESYLNQAEKSYTDDNRAKALQYASLAYLEGIEPIEMHLKATDPELSERLEKQIQRIRRLMNEGKPADEISDSISTARNTLAEVNTLLEKKEFSFFMALLMSISILLREGLEAFLVILVMLSVLKASNLLPAVKWVHAGWLAAVMLGMVLWFVSGKLIPTGGTHMAMLEGVVSIIAVLMLLYVGFWLHSKSEAGKWKEYVSNLVKGAVDNGSAVGLASLSFFVVFREVFESVLFLSALNIESAGRQSYAIMLGVVIAFIVVIMFAVIVLRFSARLPIPTLFKFSSIVMGVLAVILAGKGIHSLQEIGQITIHGLSVFRIEMLGVYPTIETCAVQLLVLMAVFFISKRKTR